MSTDANKPVRHYFASAYNRIEEGRGAMVNADVSGAYTYFTTEVLWYDSDTGVFETKNTHYVPA